MALPRPLGPLQGPLPRALAERAVRALGPAAGPSRALLEAGLLPPGALTPLTLYVIAATPRAGGGAEPSSRPGPLAGGVWVREQITYHRPVRYDVELRGTGETARRFARKGRQFSVSLSETRDAAGALLVTSRTTGLSRYRPDPELADFEEGLPEAELPPVGPDPGSAAASPSLARLRGLEPGVALAGSETEVTLERMRDLDGGRGGNPIHTDPEAARRAGLRAPIAGGSHVLAFAQEMLMDAWGPEVLLHGAHFDVRFVSPVAAGHRVVPRATVAAVTPECVEVQFEVECEGSPAAVGSARIPVGGPPGRDGFKSRETPAHGGLH